MLEHEGKEAGRSGSLIDGLRPTADRAMALIAVGIEI